MKDFQSFELGYDLNINLQADWVHLNSQSSQLHYYSTIMLLNFYKVPDFKFYRILNQYN